MSTYVNYIDRVLLVPPYPLIFLLWQSLGSPISFLLIITSFYHRIISPDLSFARNYPPPTWRLKLGEGASLKWSIGDSCQKLLLRKGGVCALREQGRASERKMIFWPKSSRIYNGGGEFRLENNPIESQQKKNTMGRCGAAQESDRHRSRAHHNRRYLIWRGYRKRGEWITIFYLWKKGSRKIPRDIL